MVQGSDGLTVRGAIVNLCNACIGIGVLAKPFALAICMDWNHCFFLAAALLLIVVYVYHLHQEHY